MRYSLLRLFLRFWRLDLRHRKGVLDRGQSVIIRMDVGWPIRVRARWGLLFI